MPTPRKPDHHKSRPPQCCCERMRQDLEHTCDQHPDPFDSPDHLVIYAPKTKTYGLIVHDGGQSFVTIDFCPWCGTKLGRAHSQEW